MTNRPLLPDALALTFNSIVLAASEAMGIAPGAGEAWVQALDTHISNYGKLSKFATVYTPVQPPPFFWRYSCDNCRAWQEPNGCRWVEGFIAAGGWCGIFMPKQGDPPFSWPTKILQDAPRWVSEAPEAFANWADAEQPPKELWIPGG